MKRRTLAIASALVAVLVLGFFAALTKVRALAGTTSVVFTSRCARTGGHSHSGDPISTCAGSPHERLLVDGREETGGLVRALPPGTRVVFTVTAASDDDEHLECAIILPGHRRTLLERRGTNKVTCAATVP